MDNARIAAGSPPAVGPVPTVPLVPNAVPGALVQPERQQAQPQAALSAQPAMPQYSGQVQVPPTPSFNQPQLPANAPSSGQMMVTGDTRGFSLAPSGMVGGSQAPSTMPTGTAVTPAAPSNMSVPVAPMQPLPQGVSQMQPPPYMIPVPPQVVQPQGVAPVTPLPAQPAPTALVPGAPMLDTISSTSAVPVQAAPAAELPTTKPSSPLVSPATPPAVSTKANKRSSLAVAALIVGIMAVILEIFISNLTNFIIAVAPVSLAAIGLGVPALGSARRGLAIAGVVLGSLSLVSVIILFSVNIATQSRCQLNPTSDPQCQAVTTQTTGVGQ